MLNIREAAAGLLALPKEIALNLPMVVCTGRAEVNVENYKNIMEYNELFVRVNTSCGPLLVEGRNLRLKRLTSENIVVAGEIAALRYSGGA